MSRGGVLLETSAPLSHETEIAIAFNIREPRRMFKASGDVLYIVEDGVSYRYNVRVDKVTGGHSQAIDSFLSNLNVYPLVKDRRDDLGKEFFPVRRRMSDDLSVRFLENPYEQFVEALSLADRGMNVRTVVVSPSLMYLGKRIRRALPNPRIVSCLDIDSTVGDGLLLVVNIDCRRKHDPYTLLDFEELMMQRRGGRAEPMQSLVELSRQVPQGSTVTIVSVSPFVDQTLVRKYLKTAKFIDIRFLSDRVVLAKKRSLLVKGLLGDQFLMEELQSQDDINAVHEFSASLYEDSNHYDKEVDSLFSFQSDYYRVKNHKTGKVITCGRVSWHLPGYPLPMMLAVRANSNNHIYLTNPDKFSYGEVYAPYMLSVTTGKIYGDLIRMVYDYCARGDMDYILTTYQAEQEKEYRFLSRCVGFKNTGVNLRYGTFGGEWRVVFASKRLFDENWELRFTSPDELPTMFKGFKQ